MYLIYSLVLALAAVITFPFFLIQGLRKGKYVRSFPLRFGSVPKEARGGGAIWLHAVSVGEVLACQQLVALLKRRFPARRLVVSTTTETGYRTAQERLIADAFFYCPLDFAFAVRRTLRAVRPALLVIAETELWPNLLHGAAHAGVPVAIVNARVSDRSFPRYHRFRNLLSRPLADVTLLLAQSEEDARRLGEIGAPAGRVAVAGNLKYDRPAPPSLPEWLDHAVRAWAGAGLLVAGSTAAGEEEVVLAAYARLADVHPPLRLVIAPRRPERFREVATLAAAASFSVARRSALSAAASVIAPDAQVLLLDTIGELSGFYRYATVAFIGGSLAPHGGQNVLEAAQFACPVVVGPHTSNFRETVDMFRNAGALIQVASADALYPALERLFSQPEAAAQMGGAARALLEANRGATERTVDRLAELMENRQPRTNTDATPIS